MPHLIETYALTCGVKIDKPFIYQKFFPLIADKFITIHPNSKYEAKCYDYWQEVVDFLKPALDKSGISIVQIGVKEDSPISGCIHTQGQTSINQAAYVVGKSILHLGADSFAVHIASGLGKKIVALYSNTFAKVVRPFWSKDSDCILMEPDRGERKPSFSERENPKSINEIKPEEVARSVLKLLNLNELVNWKTILRGPMYHQVNVQSIPNSVVNTSALNVDNLIMRMDLDHNEEVLAKQLSLCNCSIVTRRPINIEILKAFKSKIKQFVYELDENHDPDFASKVKRLGIDVILINKMSEDKLNEIKRSYFDIGIITSKQRINQKDIDKLKEQNLETLYYKSKKYIISGGKVFSSVAETKSGDPLARFFPELRKVKDDESFWADIEEFYIQQRLD